MSGPPLAAWGWVALGGAVGALARFAASLAAAHWFGKGFAWGTLAVNVVGCFAIGLVFHAIRAHALPEPARFALAIGLLGGLTTFSSFGYETWSYVERDALGLAALNVAANVVLGLAATWGGLRVAHACWPITA